MQIALSPCFSRPASLWPSQAAYGAAFVSQRFSRAGKYVPADQAFLVSRASDKFAADSFGTWHGFAPDTPAITNLGLCIELQTTNENPNAANIGAAPSSGEALDGLPTGWDRAKFDGTLIKGKIIETGTWLGLPSLTIRCWGNSDVADAELRWFIWGNLGANLPIAQNDQFLMSFFLERIAGSNANISTQMRMTERDSEGVYLVKQIQGFSPSSGPVRHAHTFTVANASAARAVLGLEFGFSGPFDITFRLAGAQIERTDASTPTSPVLSAGTPATRQADVLTLNLPETPLDLTVSYSNGDVETISAQSGETAFGSDDFARSPIGSIVG